MCIKLTRIHECENADHPEHWLIRCSNPLDSDAAAANSDQLCLLLPTEVTEYWNEPCGACSGDKDGPPSLTATLTQRFVFEPWHQVPPNLEETNFEKFHLLKEETSFVGGPSLEYAQKLARWIYYVMTRDVDEKYVTLPDYIKPTPGYSEQQHQQSVWLERYRSMLPEICCRSDPAHGASYGLFPEEPDVAEGEEVPPVEDWDLVWGDRLTCECLDEAMPFLTNPLLQVRREAAFNLLSDLVQRVTMQDEDHIKRLYTEQELLHQQLRLLGPVFKKRNAGVKEGVRMLRPMDLGNLEKLIHQLTLHVSKPMENYIESHLKRATPLARGMTEHEHLTELRARQSREHLVKRLVIHLVARDPGLTPTRQIHIIRHFYERFFLFNHRMVGVDGLEFDDPNYFFRLAYIAMREAHDRTKNFKDWIDFAAFGSNGIEMHTLYQHSLYQWEQFYREHMDRYDKIESLIVDAKLEEVTILKDEERECPICGDDLLELLQSQPNPGRNKRFMKPAQPLTCSQENNKHWQCKSCLLRKGLTRTENHTFPVARCALCRKPYDPEEYKRELEEQAQDEAQGDSE